MWKSIKGHLLSAITAVAEHKYLLTKQRRRQKNIYTKQDDVACVKQNIIMCFHACQLQRMALKTHQERNISLFVHDQKCSQEEVLWIAQRKCHQGIHLPSPEQFFQIPCKLQEAYKSKGQSG